VPNQAKRGTKASDPPGRKRQTERSKRPHPPSGKPPRENARVKWEAKDSGNDETPENAVVAKAVPMLLERGTPSLTLDIGVRRRLIIHTGSNVSIMKSGVASSDISATPLKPFGVTGKTLDFRGRQTVTLKLGGRKFKHVSGVSPPYGYGWLIRRRFLRSGRHYKLREQ